LVPVIFVLLSACSASYIVISALNYDQFFPALDQIQTHTSLSSPSLVQDSASNRSWLKAQVTLANPTSYRGIVIASIRLAVYFVHVASQGNLTLFQNPPLLGSKSGGPLGPHEQATFDLIVPLSQQNASSLISFRGQYPGQVVAVTQVTVELATFLEAAGGRIAYLIQREFPFS
jgi:hypothetical protein